MCGFGIVPTWAVITRASANKQVACFVTLFGPLFRYATCISALTFCHSKLWLQIALDAAAVIHDLSTTILYICYVNIIFCRYITWIQSKEYG